MAEPFAQEDTVLTARESLHTLYRYACRAADERELPWIITAFNDVMAVFPKGLQPTMDKVEWDDEKHHLAEAHVLFTPNPHHVVCMLRPATDEDILTNKQLMRGETIPKGKYIRVIDNELIVSIEAEVLAPTGHKYKLVSEESA